MISKKTPSYSVQHYQSELGVGQTMAKRSVQEMRERPVQDHRSKTSQWRQNQSKAQSLGGIVRLTLRNSSRVQLYAHFQQAAAETKAGKSIRSMLQQSFGAGILITQFATAQAIVSQKFLAGDIHYLIVSEQLTSWAKEFAREERQRSENTKQIFVYGLQDDASYKRRMEKRATTRRDKIDAFVEFVHHSDEDYAITTMYPQLKSHVSAKLSEQRGKFKGKQLNSYFVHMYVPQGFDYLSTIYNKYKTIGNVRWLQVHQYNGFQDVMRSICERQRDAPLDSKQFISSRQSIPSQRRLQAEEKTRTAVLSLSKDDKNIVIVDNNVEYKEMYFIKSLAKLNNNWSIWELQGDLTLFKNRLKLLIEDWEVNQEELEGEYRKQIVNCKTLYVLCHAQDPYTKALFQKEKNKHAHTELFTYKNQKQLGKILQEKIGDPQDFVYVATPDLNTHLQYNKIITAFENRYKNIDVIKNYKIVTSQNNEYVQAMHSRTKLNQRNTQVMGVSMHGASGKYAPMVQKVANENYSMYNTRPNKNTDSNLNSVSQIKLGHNNTQSVNMNSLNYTSSSRTILGKSSMSNHIISLTAFMKEREQFLDPLKRMKGQSVFLMINEKKQHLLDGLRQYISTSNRLVISTYIDKEFLRRNLNAILLKDNAIIMADDSTLRQAQEVALKFQQVFILHITDRQNVQRQSKVLKCGTLAAISEYIEQIPQKYNSLLQAEYTQEEGPIVFLRKNNREIPVVKCKMGDIPHVRIPNSLQVSNGKEYVESTKMEINLRRHFDQQVKITYYKDQTDIRLFNKKEEPRSYVVCTADHLSQMKKIAVEGYAQAQQEFILFDKTPDKYEKLVLESKYERFKVITNSWREIQAYIKRSSGIRKEKVQQKKIGIDRCIRVFVAEKGCGKMIDTVERFRDSEHIRGANQIAFHNVVNIQKVMGQNSIYDKYYVVVNDMEKEGINFNSAMEMVKRYKGLQIMHIKKVMGKNNENSNVVTAFSGERQAGMWLAHTKVIEYPQERILPLILFDRANANWEPFLAKNAENNYNYAFFDCEQELVTEVEKCNAEQNPLWILVGEQEQIEKYTNILQTIPGDNGRFLMYGQTKIRERVQFSSQVKKDIEAFILNYHRRSRRVMFSTGIASNKVVLVLYTGPSHSPLYISESELKSWKDHLKAKIEGAVTQNQVHAIAKENLDATLYIVSTGEREFQLERLCKKYKKVKRIICDSRANPLCYTKIESDSNKLFVGTSAVEVSDFLKHLRYNIRSSPARLRKQYSKQITELYIHKDYMLNTMDVNQIQKKNDSVIVNRIGFQTQQLHSLMVRASHYDYNNVFVGDTKIVEAVVQYNKKYNAGLKAINVRASPLIYMNTIPVEGIVFQTHDQEQFLTYLMNLPQRRYQMSKTYKDTVRVYIRKHDSNRSLVEYVKRAKVQNSRIELYEFDDVRQLSDIKENAIVFATVSQIEEYSRQLNNNPYIKYFIVNPNDRPIPDYVYNSSKKKIFVSRKNDEVFYFLANLPVEGEQNISNLQTIAVNIKQNCHLVEGLLQNHRSQPVIDHKFKLVLMPPFARHKPKQSRKVRAPIYGDAVSVVFPNEGILDTRIPKLSYLGLRNSPPLPLLSLTAIQDIRRMKVSHQVIQKLLRPCLDHNPTQTWVNIVSEPDHIALPHPFASMTCSYEQVLQQEQYFRKNRTTKVSYNYSTNAQDISITNETHHKVEEVHLKPQMQKQSSQSRASVADKYKEQNYKKDYERNEKIKSKPNIVPQYSSKKVVVVEKQYSKKESSSSQFSAGVMYPPIPSLLVVFPQDKELVDVAYMLKNNLDPDQYIITLLPYRNSSELEKIPWEIQVNTYDKLVVFLTNPYLDKGLLLQSYKAKATNKFQYFEVEQDFDEQSYEKLACHLPPFNIRTVDLPWVNPIRPRHLTSAQQLNILVSQPLYEMYAPLKSQSVEVEAYEDPAQCQPYLHRLDQFTIIITDKVSFNLFKCFPRLSPRCWLLVESQQPLYDDELQLSGLKSYSLFYGGKGVDLLQKKIVPLINTESFMREDGRMLYHHTDLFTTAMSKAYKDYQKVNYSSYYQLYQSLLFTYPYFQKNALLIINESNTPEVVELQPKVYMENTTYMKEFKNNFSEGGYLNEEKVRRRSQLAQHQFAHLKEIYYKNSKELEGLLAREMSPSVVLTNASNIGIGQLQQRYREKHKFVSVMDNAERWIHSNGMQPQDITDERLFKKQDIFAAMFNAAVFDSYSNMQFYYLSNVANIDRKRNIMFRSREDLLTTFEKNPQQLMVIFVEAKDQHHMPQLLIDEATLPIGRVKLILLSTDFIDDNENLFIKFNEIDPIINRINIVRNVDKVLLQYVLYNAAEGQRTRQSLIQKKIINNFQNCPYTFTGQIPRIVKSIRGKISKLHVICKVEEEDEIKECLQSQRIPGVIVHFYIVERPTIFKPSNEVLASVRSSMRSSIKGDQILDQLMKDPQIAKMYNKDPAVAPTKKRRYSGSGLIQKNSENSSLLMERNHHAFERIQHKEQSNNKLEVIASVNSITSNNVTSRHTIISRPTSRPKITIDYVSPLPSMQFFHPVSANSIKRPSKPQIKTYDNQSFASIHTEERSQSKNSIYNNKPQYLNKKQQINIVYQNNVDHNRSSQQRTTFINKPNTNMSARSNKFQSNVFTDVKRTEAHTFESDRGVIIPNMRQANQFQRNISFQPPIINNNVNQPMQQNNAVQFASNKTNQYVSDHSTDNYLTSNKESLREKYEYNANDTSIRNQQSRTFSNSNFSSSAYLKEAKHYTQEVYENIENIVYTIEESHIQKNNHLFESYQGLSANGNAVDNIQEKYKHSNGVNRNQYYNKDNTNNSDFNYNQKHNYQLIETKYDNNQALNNSKDKFNTYSDSYKNNYQVTQNKYNTNQAINTYQNSYKNDYQVTQTKYNTNEALNNSKDKFNNYQNSYKNNYQVTQTKYNTNDALNNSKDKFNTYSDSNKNNYQATDIKYNTNDALNNSKDKLNTYQDKYQSRYNRSNNYQVTQTKYDPNDALNSSKDRFNNYQYNRSNNYQVTQTKYDPNDALNNSKDRFNNYQYNRSNNYQVTQTKYDPNDALKNSKDRFNTYKTNYGNNQIKHNIYQEKQTTYNDANYNYRPINDDYNSINTNVNTFQTSSYNEYDFKNNRATNRKDYYNGQNSIKISDNYNNKDSTQVSYKNANSAQIPHKYTNTLYNQIEGAEYKIQEDYYEDHRERQNNDQEQQDAYEHRHNYTVEAKNEYNNEEKRINLIDERQQFVNYLKDHVIEQHEDSIINKGQGSIREQEQIQQYTDRRQQINHGYTQQYAQNKGLPLVHSYQQSGASKHYSAVSKASSIKEEINIQNQLMYSRGSNKGSGVENSSSSLHTVRGEGSELKSSLNQGKNSSGSNFYGKKEGKNDIIYQIGEAEESQMKKSESSNLYGYQSNKKSNKDSQLSDNNRFSKRNEQNSIVQDNRSNKGSKNINLYQSKHSQQDEKKSIKGSKHSEIIKNKYSTISKGSQLEEHKFLKNSKHSQQSNNSDHFSQHSNDLANSKNEINKLPIHGSSSKLKLDMINSRIIGKNENRIQQGMYGSKGFNKPDINNLGLYSPVKKQIRQGMDFNLQYSKTPSNQSNLSSKNKYAALNNQYKQKQIINNQKQFIKMQKNKIQTVQQHQQISFEGRQGLRLKKFDQIYKILMQPQLKIYVSNNLTQFFSQSQFQNIDFFKEQSQMRNRPQGVPQLIITDRKFNQVQDLSELTLGVLLTQYEPAQITSLQFLSSRMIQLHKRRDSMDLINLISRRANFLQMSKKLESYSHARIVFDDNADPQHLKIILALAQYHDKIIPVLYTNNNAIAEYLQDPNCLILILQSNQKEISLKQQQDKANFIVNNGKYFKTIYRRKNKQLNPIPQVDSLFEVDLSRSSAMIFTDDEIRKYLKECGAMSGRSRRLLLLNKASGRVPMKSFNISYAEPQKIKKNKLPVVQETQIQNMRTLVRGDLIVLLVEQSKMEEVKNSLQVYNVLVQSYTNSMNMEIALSNHKDTFIICVINQSYLDKIAALKRKYPKTFFFLQSNNTQSYDNPILAGTIQSAGQIDFIIKQIYGQHQKKIFEKQKQPRPLSKADLLNTFNHDKFLMGVRNTPMKRLQMYYRDPQNIGLRRTLADTFQHITYIPYTSITHLQQLFNNLGPALTCLVIINGNEVPEIEEYFARKVRDGVYLIRFNCHPSLPENPKIKRIFTAYRPQDLEHFLYTQFNRLYRGSVDHSRSNSNKSTSREKSLKKNYLEKFAPSTFGTTNRFKLDYIPSKSKDMHLQKAGGRLQERKFNPLLSPRFSSNNSFTHK